jgi:hypothetical protein
MSAQGAELLMHLIGGMIYGGQPRANPTYQDRVQQNNDPNFTGPHIAPTYGGVTPYRQPGFFENTLAPDVARQEWALNNAGYQSQVDRLNRRNLVGADLDTYGALPTGENRDRMITEMGGNTSAQNYESVLRAHDNVLNGLPAISSAADTLHEQNRGLGEMSDYTGSIPQKRSALEGTNLDYGLGLGSQLRNVEGGNQLWQQSNVQPINDVNEYLTAQGRRKIIPTLSDAGYLNARTDLSEAGTRNRLEPTTYEDTMIKNQYDAAHPNDPYNSRAGFFKNGKYYPGIPDYATQMKNQMASGMQQPITLGSGLSGQVARPSYQPTISGSLVDASHSTVNPSVQKAENSLEQESQGFHEHPEMQPVLEQAQKALSEHGPDSKEYAEAAQKVHEKHYELLRQQRGLPAANKKASQATINSFNQLTPEERQHQDFLLQGSTPATQFYQ